MKGQRIHRKIMWLGTALFLLACVSPLLATSLPPQTPQVLLPELMGTSIEQTAAAAQTQTVVYAPPTLTPTLTPLPTRTSVVFTSTPTFIYLLPTITPLPTWTPLPGIIVQLPPGTGDAGNNGTPTDSPFTDREWTCAIRGKSPPMGTVMPQGESFYVSITLMNTGTRTWPYNSVDFIYQNGLRIEGRKIQDLPRSVARGQEITLQSLLVAPKQPGIYNTTWTLKVGNNPFCGVKYSFKVD